MVIWFTGRSGSGKTTLCKNINSTIPCVHLDDDRINTILHITGRLDHSEHDIDSYTKASEALAVFALDLSNQGHIVVISSMLPIQSMRDHLDNVCDINWITVVKDSTSRQTDVYEVNPEYPIVNNDKLNEEEALKEVLKLIKAE